LALPDGSVTAFEPIPAVSDRLRLNLAQNSNGHDWTVEAFALYDENRRGTIALGSEDPGSGTHALSESGEVTIQLRRANDYLDDTPAPDVVKIDVEGVEMAILEGFGDYLTDIETFFIEVHPH